MFECHSFRLLIDLDVLKLVVTITISYILIKLYIDNLNSIFNSFNLFAAKLLKKIDI